MRPSLQRLSVVVFVVFAVATVAARRARADPRIAESRVEDAWADGDLDAEDLAASSRPDASTRVGAGDVRGRSWLSIAGFYGVFPDGTREYGAVAVLGLALDRMAAGPVHRTRERAPPFIAEPPTASTDDGAPAASSFLIAAPLARATVAAAWRAAGVESGDARIDAIIHRAHLSALLPETRLRAMRLVDERAHTDAAYDAGRSYDLSGANLWLEARLTWRFDRLVYADDEPTLERVRLEREDARSRIAARVLELLFQWQRARLDLATAAAASRAAVEASLRMAETEAALDVATAGWFTGARVAPAASPPPPSSAPSSPNGGAPSPPPASSAPPAPAPPPGSSAATSPRAQAAPP